MGKQHGSWDSKLKELPRANLSKDARSWIMPVTTLTGGVQQAYFRCPNYDHLESNSAILFELAIWKK